MAMRLRISPRTGYSTKLFVSDNIPEYLVEGSEFLCFTDLISRGAGAGEAVESVGTIGLVWLAAGGKWIRTVGSAWGGRRSETASPRSGQGEAAPRPC